MRVGNGYVVPFLFSIFCLNDAGTNVFAGFGTSLWSTLLPVDVLAYNQEFWSKIRPG
jgi:hypothetical protein